MRAPSMGAAARQRAPVGVAAMPWAGLLLLSLTTAALATGAMTTGATAGGATASGATAGVSPPPSGPAGASAVPPPGVEAFGLAHPDCREWSDGCTVCLRHDSGEAGCSTAAIACQPTPAACRTAAGSKPVAPAPAGPERETGTAK